MSPMVAMIQPMALVGRLATSSPPTTAKAPNPAEHHALHVVDHCVFVPQAGTICEEVARASANDVQGHDQPPRYARNDEQRATTHTTDFLPLFSRPFSHSTNLQHYRLPNVTMTILWSESEPSEIDHEDRHFCPGIVRVPEVPLLLRDEVAGIAENESFLLIQLAAEVVRVGVGGDDRVDLGRFDPEALR